MLQKLNERLQGFVAWFIIILIAITFSLFGLNYYLQSRQADNVKAKVNEEAISNNSFELAYRRARAQRDINTLTSLQDKKIQQEVLDQLILNKVKVLAAKNEGFYVNLQQANSAIMDIPQFKDKGKFSADRYRQALTNAMYTPDSFQKEVRQGMLLNQQRFAFIGTSFVLPDEIKRFVRLYMQSRDYNYLIIPYKKFINLVSVDNNELMNYYTKNKQSLKTPEQVSISYVKLSMKNIVENIKISNDEIRQYYEDNQENYLNPAQWKVAHILLAFPINSNKDGIKKIEQKADNIFRKLQSDKSSFDEFVRKYSADKISLKDKGILPLITAGQTQYDSELSKLSNPGQISKPIKTKQGYEIFKLIKFTPSSVKPFKKVKGIIKEHLIAEKAQKLYSQKYEILSDISYQNPDSLEPVAKELNIDIQKTKPFTRNGGDTTITKNRRVISASYSHDVLELANNSEPLQIDNDSVVVLRINKHLKSEQIPFAQAKKDIEKQLIKIKAINKASDFAEKIAQDKNPKQNNSLSNIGLKWMKTRKATRNENNTQPLITELAFNITKINKKIIQKLPNDNIVIVELEKIHEGKIGDLDNEQKQSIKQQIEATYGLVVYDFYINQLMNEAEIKQS